MQRISSADDAPCAYKYLSLSNTELSKHASRNRDQPLFKHSTQMCMPIQFACVEFNQASIYLACRCVCMRLISFKIDGRTDVCSVQHARLMNTTSFKTSSLGDYFIIPLKPTAVRSCQMCVIFLAWNTYNPQYVLWIWFRGVCQECVLPTIR